MVDYEIAALVRYAVDKKLIEPADRTWAVNQILTVLELDSFEEPKEAPKAEAAPKAPAFRGF